MSPHYVLGTATLEPVTSGIARGCVLTLRDVGSPDPTPRLRGGESAGISDGNRDGNDGSRHRPDTAVNR